MPMDRAERIGFGTALGGHAALLGLFALGAFFAADRITKPQPISVTLEAEMADVSTAPDPVQEEPAPAENAAEPTPVEPDPTPVAQVEPTPPKPLPTPQPKPLPKVVEKPKQQPKPAPKQTKPQPKPKQSPRWSPDFERAVQNPGANPKPTTGTAPKAGTAAAKPAAEVRRAISVSINAEVRTPWNGCKFSGVDVDQLKTVVRFGLNRDGTLSGFRSVVTSGQNDSNKFQVNRHQECAKLAIRQASPFNLPPENYDFWKEYELELFKR